MKPVRTSPVATRLRAPLSCLCVLLLTSAAALAQKPAAPIAVKLDPATTQIHWTLVTTVHTVHGTFKLKNGSFEVDPATGNASGQIVIDATSGQSGDSPRDNRMHREVLESAKYPTITFRPTHVDGGAVSLEAPGPVKVDGVLNIHGQDHPMQITVNLHPENATAVDLQTHFDVPFVAWGLKDPSTFIFRVNKQVQLDVDATAVPAAEIAHLR